MQVSQEFIYVLGLIENLKKEVEKLQSEIKGKTDEVEIREDKISETTLIPQTDSKSAIYSFNFKKLMMGILFLSGFILGLTLMFLIKI